jgi:hypothetical protein
LRYVIEEIDPWNRGARWQQVPQGRIGRNLTDCATSERHQLLVTIDCVGVGMVGLII